MGLRRKPSVVFYGGRPTEYVSAREPARVLARISGPPPRVALTDAITFARLARSLPLEAIERNTGYVLFRPAPIPADESGAALSSSGVASP